ncbi:MAG: ABC transporter substrate-binding protein [Armatimonadetes bacterium]|nr:ABC transporter substrate-binding protein [Armatimonadota bacterium]
MNTLTEGQTDKPACSLTIRLRGRSAVESKMGVLFIALFLGGCTHEQTKVHGKKLVRVWHVWGGTMAEGFNKVCDAFRKTHPDIDLRPVFAANDLATNQKFFTAVAARKPPEVIFVDGPQVASWAEWGALEPLTNLCKQSGINEKDYFAPCWRQNAYEGNVWAMTFCADPNFGFVWNKNSFRKAGLDPERPPKTIEELDRYARALTMFEKGELVRVGLIPWAQYGQANSIFTWGWAFGGDFFDYKTNRITADNERVVKALEWMVSYAKQYDVTKVASLQQGFGSAEQNPFITGKVAMMCLHIGGIADLARYAPDLDYGVTYIPSPPEGEQHSSWVGGWCVALPNGARNRDAAWEFVRWLCASTEGTELAGKSTGLFPGLKTSPYFETVRGKKHYDKFLQILQECRHQRPVMPVQARYMRELSRAVDAAVYGKATPKEALARARVATQRELDILGQGGKGRS